MGIDTISQELHVPHGHIVAPNTVTDSQTGLGDHTPPAVVCCQLTDTVIKYTNKSNMDTRNNSVYYASHISVLESL